MRKYITVIIVILILSLIASSFIYKTSAVGLDIIGDPNDYRKDPGMDNGGAVKVGNIVVMLLVLGIKYILGSVEEKAEYKQTMWPYVIGAVLIFSGAAVTDIIYKAFNG